MSEPEPSENRAIRNASPALERLLSPLGRSVAFPPDIPGVAWSDHWSFWQVGYPALMVTDTAPFRYPHYHLASDTPDKVDALHATGFDGLLDRVFARGQMVTGVSMLVGTVGGGVLGQIDLSVPFAARAGLLHICDKTM